MNRLFQLALVAIVLISMPTSVDAHPFHASVTEVEWNAKSQRFEVAMRLRIADLEDAISARINTRFRLENSLCTSKDAAVHLKSYLTDNFSVTYEVHELCRLHWVGCELELHDVWIYFEAESVGDLPVSNTNKIDNWEGLLKAASQQQLQQAVRVRNSILTEIQVEQVNTTQIRIGSQKSKVTFDHKKRDLLVTFDNTRDKQQSGLQ